MKKYYNVELSTSQPFADGEDFWMYRLYPTKEEAFSVAEILSKFFPYTKYPTEIIVKEYDIVGRSLQNEKVVKRYRLKDENGRVVKAQKVDGSTVAA